jgi:hypothetical protein
MKALEMALEALTNPSTIAVQHAIELIRAELAKPEQDTYCKYCNGIGCVACDARCLPEQELVRWFQQFGDAPPRKEWVGLTNDEVYEIANFCKDQPFNFYAREIENKLRSKNAV